MTTFSELVDKMILETKRPDMAVEIASYLNQTLREVHSEPERGKAVYYKDNLRETQILSGVAEGFQWLMPNAAVFQAMCAVRYDSVFNERYEPVWATELTPGVAMNRKPYWFYRVGNTITFKGYGGIGASLSISWFEYTQSLKYYAAGTRPCTYDMVSGFTYAPDYDVSDATRLQAQQLCTNWLLLRWPTVIEEGVRAKVYKRLSDDSRARTSYSMYKTLWMTLYSAETADVGGPR